MHRKHFSTPPKRVALFVTCMVDMIYPDAGMATVELLEKQGIEIIFPEEQTCCGQPAFNAGYRDEARTLAIRFVDIFYPLVMSGKVDAIVSPSGSCNTMVSHFYDVLFEDPKLSTYRSRAATLSEVTFELTEFLVDVLNVTDVEAVFKGKITYHACCHLLRELGIDRQPRTLLEHVKDAQIVPLGGSEECCGFGGLFSIKNADISTAMGQRKTVNLAESGADVVALCDVSCMTHINGLLERQAQRCRAVHIAEILNNQIPAPQSAPAQSTTTSGNAPRRWQDAK
ncbi:MAG: (Fe-S)-binding protein [Caldilineaceae bacterium]